MPRASQNVRHHSANGRHHRIAQHVHIGDDPNRQVARRGSLSMKRQRKTVEEWYYLIAHFREHAIADLGESNAVSGNRTRAQRCNGHQRDDANQQQFSGGRLSSHAINDMRACDAVVTL